MQLPAPNISAKVIVSIREALLLYELHAFISHTHWVVCCSFTFIIIGGYSNSKIRRHCLIAFEKLKQAV